MRAFVFTDKALERYAGRFVWLAVDTENSKNSNFLRKYPITVWPTLLVIDPKREVVTIRYAGGMTAPQLSKLLDQAEKSYGAKSEGESDRLLASADKYASQQMSGEAAVLYEQAIAKAPKNWPKLGRAAESLTFTLMVTDHWRRCSDFAADLAPKLRGSLSGANVASNGLSCAVDDKGLADRADRIRSFQREIRNALDDPKVNMSGDDRSGLFDALSSGYDALGEKEALKKTQEEWLATLEREAAAAKNPEQRAVYDPFRLTLYLALGTPEKAVPMLEQSERDLPDDYNPPARLAAALRALKRYDEALAASDRALAKAYGPRKIGILRTRAEIYVSKGDPAAARKTIEDAIEYAKSLPQEQRSERTIAALEKRLADIK